jgi:flagellum-specific peptidoglycan hydrolase FlgJ
MTPSEFLPKALAEAKAAGHIFPGFAAAEAALESAWGRSKLAVEANNLFGQKQHTHPDHGTLILPTKEFLSGRWVTVSAEWEKFDSWRESFSARMDTLRKLAPKYPHYANALAATTGEKFVEEVSKSWATDPNRAAKVLATYRAHRDVLE